MDINRRMEMNGNLKSKKSPLYVVTICGRNSCMCETNRSRRARSLLCKSVVNHWALKIETTNG